MRQQRGGRVAAVTTLVALGAMIWFGAGTSVVDGARQDDGAEVAIDFPVDGAEVAGPGVVVQWSLSPTAEDRDDLHVDLIVDGGEARIDRAANPVVVDGLQPGEHEIELVVENDNDQLVLEIDGAAVTFTVLYPLPVRLQAGTCDDLDEDPVAFLNDVESRFQSGEEDSEEPLPLGADGFNPVEVSDTRLELPMAVVVGEEHALAVYAPGADLDDETEPDEVVACAVIGGPTYSNDLRVALTSMNDSGAFGLALVRDEGRRTRIRIELYRAEVDPVATPQPTATATPEETATPEVTATPLPTQPPIPTATQPPIVPPTQPPLPLPTQPPPPPAQTNTPVPPPPTNTPVPPPAPTNTPAPLPTNTPLPPAPTSTPLPPPAATDTPVPPPTATDTPAPPA